MANITKVFLTMCFAVLAVQSQDPTPRTQFQQLTTARLAQIPDFVLPAIYSDRTAHPLPAAVDNSTLKYFPPYSWCIDGWSCANAVGSSYCYNYEVLNMQDSTNPSGNPKYTYNYTYHLLNSGNQSTGGDGWMFIDVFEQAKKTGILTSADFGGFTWGDQFGGWASGYDKYYQAMKVRAREYYKIDATIAANEVLVKQFLYDHGDQSAHGGLLAVQVNDGTWATGTVSGKTVFTKIGGGGGHALTVCGYDDSFDGGSYKLCGNWGEGFYWAPYSLFLNGAGWYPDNTSDPFQNNKYFMGVRIRSGYKPKLTFKVSLTHSQRNQISISTGVAASTTATAPTTTTNYYALVNYTGGSNPMCGAGQSSTIELGLDLTDLDTIIPGGQGTFFLQVVSKGGTGQVNSLALEDYTGSTTREIVCTQTNKAISGTILMSIPWTGSITEAQFRQASVDHQGNGLVAEYSSTARTIQFSFPGANVRTALLQIRDMRGRTLMTKTCAGVASGATGTASWDMKNYLGQKVSPGSYVASVTMTNSDGTTRQLVTKVAVRN
jgi:hypothetical protein